MPEEQEAAQPQQDAQQQGQKATLHVRDHDTKTAYANMCLLSSTAEEMILNFGLTLPMPSQEKPEAQMLVTNRVIMGLPAAKRLAIALSQTIQQYENAFGVINVQPRRPTGQPAAATEAPPPSE